MLVNIPPVDNSIKSALLDKINHKTKPLGALGQLETTALTIGLIQQTLSPRLNAPTILVFAADHGIANAGVSAYPQAVTAQMVSNFMQGGAAINVFTKQNDLDFKLIDAGVNHTFEDNDQLINAKIALGTQNFATTQAMSLAQCNAAMAKGVEIMHTTIAQGCNVVGFGEMGICNTSSASCLLATLCGLPIEACVGRGTGVDDVAFKNKINTLSEAIAVHQLTSDDDPINVLATFGGFEIAMMVGAMLKAAEEKCVLIIDGFIVSAALLVASKIEPNILDYCIYAHCSQETAHKALLTHLGATPLLHLDMRLGEGTGAALAYPLILSSVNFLNEMASFESANVSQKS
jgi:nicotinate-nucleotide--dimethylbenzimidazole phosphoribosyltransferase